MMATMKIALFIIGLVHFALTLSSCTGSPPNNDLDDSAFHEYFSSFLSHFAPQPEGTQSEQIELIKINNFTPKSVNGLDGCVYDFDAQGVKTHKLYKCYLVLSQPMEEGGKILSYNCQQQPPTRSKRSVGGEIEVDVMNNTHLLELKPFIKGELSSYLKGGYLVDIVKFVRATRQIVAGVKTRAVVEVAPTECRNDTNKCRILPKDHQICSIEILEKPWLKSKQLKVKECTDVPHYCSGCLMELNPDDELANQCLKRTLYNLNTKAHSHKQLKLVRIINVQYQVVAGLKYNIEFEAEDQSNAHYSCRASVVSQPWISREPLVDEFSCHLVKQIEA